MSRDEEEKLLKEVDHLGVPLWYRLGQALCPTSEAVLPERFRTEAQHLVRHMARHGIKLAELR
jgi:hypothetical protein